MLRFMHAHSAQTYALMRIVTGFLFLWHGTQKLFSVPTPPPQVSSFVIAIATEKVQTLITKMGFDVVNAGPLKSARNIEPLAMLNISLGYGQGLGTSMGFTLLR